MPIFPDGFAAAWQGWAMTQLAPDLFQRMEVRAAGSEQGILFAELCQLGSDIGGLVAADYFKSLTAGFNKSIDQFMQPGPGQLIARRVGEHGSPAR